MEEERKMADCVVEFDEHGFAVFTPFSDFVEDDYRVHSQTKHNMKELEKINKHWNKILENWKQNQLTSPQQLRQSIKQGLPNTLRGRLWNLLLGTQALKSNSPFNYEAYVGELRQMLVDLGVSEFGGHNCIARLGKIIGTLGCTSSEDDPVELPWNLCSMNNSRKQTASQIQQEIIVYRQIMLDVDRSFPTHKMFMDGTTEGKEGRAALFRVLAVYAKYNPDVSYCQGMSYIGGMLLMNTGEEEAFWCLVSLFERPKYLAGYFDNSLSKIQRHAAVFERLMKQRKPKMFKHLEKQGIYPLMYLTPWFMALYTSLPCWGTVLTIWDLLLLEGISVIFQVAFAILDVLSDRLMLYTEIAKTLPLLLRLPADLTTRGHVVPVIWRTKVPRWEIECTQNVLEEEKSYKQEKLRKRTLAASNRDGESTAVKRKRTLPPASSQDVPDGDASIFQRMVGFLAAPFKQSLFSVESENAGAIEMKTFARTAADSKSPVVQPGCCSSAISPFAFGRSTHPSSSYSDTPSPRNSPGPHRVFRTPGITCQVRRSPCLASKRVPLKTLNSPSIKRLLRSASEHHAFKHFHTPTPLRKSQVRSRRYGVRNSEASSPLAVVSPEDKVFLSPDRELVELIHNDAIGCEPMQF